MAPTNQGFSAGVIRKAGVGEHPNNLLDRQWLSGWDWLGIVWLIFGITKGFWSATRPRFCRWAAGNPSTLGRRLHMRPALSFLGCHETPRNVKLVAVFDGILSLSLPSCCHQVLMFVADAFATWIQSRKHTLSDCFLWEFVKWWSDWLRKTRIL